MSGGGGVLCGTAAKTRDDSSLLKDQLATQSAQSCCNKNESSTAEVCYLAGKESNRLSSYPRANLSGGRITQKVTS
eukprot:13283631-Ditylum_brightwellii.AAC.1